MTTIGALGSTAWPDVGPEVLFVPVGSTEQHGPHLPLDTDTAIAAAVTDGLVARYGPAALAAPAIAYGASGEHEDFPGTVSIGSAALEMLLLELGRSASVWAARIVFVNGHGGNLDALSASVSLLRAEGRDAAWVPCAVPRESADADSHAGFLETAIIRFLRPGDVRMERAVAGETRPLPDLLPSLRREGVRAVSPSGVLGDPRGATAQHGAAFLDTMIELVWRRVAGGRVDARGCLQADQT